MMIKILSNSFDIWFYWLLSTKKILRQTLLRIDGLIDADHVIDPISVSDNSSPLIQTMEEYMKYLPP